MNLDKLTEAIASGTLGIPPGLSHEERLAFVNQRLKELGFDEPLKPLRKHDPQACLALARKYIDQMRWEPNIEDGLRKQDEDSPWTKRRKSMAVSKPTFEEIDKQVREQLDA